VAPKRPSDLDGRIARIKSDATSSKKEGSVADRSGGYVLQPEEGELRWMGKTFTHFLADGDLTEGAFALVDERAHRGMAVPLHVHREDMESFYVLEGEITLHLDGRDGVRAGPGAFAHVPGGTVHGFRVESETARYLILTTPRHGAFYRAITLASRPDGSPPLESMERATIEKACDDYGVEFVGPLPDGA
jgi:quercetin dioxygenase-like cupin family protein